MHRRPSYTRPATLTGVLVGLIALIASCTDKGGEQDVELAVLLGAALSRTYPGYLFIGRESHTYDKSPHGIIARYGFQRTGTPLTALSPSSDTYWPGNLQLSTFSNNHASYLSKHPTLNGFYNRKGSPFAAVTYLEFHPANGTTSETNSGIGLGALGAGSAFIAPNGKYLLYHRSGYAQLTGHALDPATGAVNPIPSGHQSPSLCGYILRGVIHPNSKFAIVPCSSMFHVFTINPETGDPTAKTAYNIIFGGAADDIAIQTNGNFVYTLNSNIPNIGQFSMDPDTGVLTQLMWPIVSTPGLNPGYHASRRRMVVNPGANFLYVASEGLLLSYSFSAQTGLLTYQETISITLNGSPGLSQIHDITFDETGEYMFVSSSEFPSVAVFRVDKTTGALSVVQYMDTLAPEETSRSERPLTIIYMKGL